MASIHHGGGLQDFSALADSSLLTTTTQFACVSMVPTASTAANFTVQLSNTSSVYNFAIGINQTQLSSTAMAACTVRMLGPSKAIAAGTITAGEFCTVADSLGRLSAFIPTSLTATGVYLPVVGRALTSAATAGAEFLIYVNPYISAK